MEYNLKLIEVSFHNTKYPAIRSYAVNKMSLHQRERKCKIPYSAQLLHACRIQLVNYITLNHPSTPSPPLQMLITDDRSCQRNVSTTRRAIMYQSNSSIRQEKCDDITTSNGFFEPSEMPY